MNMKQILAIPILLALLVAFTACNRGENAGAGQPGAATATTRGGEVEEIQAEDTSKVVTTDSCSVAKADDASQPEVKPSGKKWALLVGISEYPQSTRWNEIHGANDVELLQAPLKNQGFSVTALTNSQATHDNIIKNLKALEGKVQPGDIVYLHFSTHGQPFEDGLKGEAKDEGNDGWDESIVPYDANKRYSDSYTGENHLTDDELKVYTDKLRKKLGTSYVYVVLDACHAGSSSQGSDDATRGTKDGFSSGNKTYDANADKKANSTKIYRPKHIENWADILYLEACESWQINTEIEIENKKYGSLSYMIYLALANNGPEIWSNRNKLEAAVIDLTSVQSKHKHPKWPNHQNLVVEKSF